MKNKNGICTRTGKEIPFNEIMTQQNGRQTLILWDKDKGGTHTLDNGQLIDATFNNKK